MARHRDINLLAALTAAENVSLPLELGGARPRSAMAAARALLLADELTGALDSLSGEPVMQLLRAQSDDGCAVVLVTHDVRHAAGAPAN